MTASLATFFALVCLTRGALAQTAPAPVPMPARSPAAYAAPTEAFLEQRVAGELAADGMLLSWLGVDLDVELVGDKVIVSLVDPATHRPVASTKLDSMPADRDAAVAAVTQVATPYALGDGGASPSPDGSSRVDRPQPF